MVIIKSKLKINVGFGKELLIVEKINVFNDKNKKDVKNIIYPNTIIIFFNFPPLISPILNDVILLIF